MPTSENASNFIFELTLKRWAEKVEMKYPFDRHIVLAR
jgi:hypothetical protein